MAGSARVLPQRIGFLGAGRMTRAIVGGILAAKSGDSAKLIASSPDEASRRSLPARCQSTADNRQVVSSSDAVVLAVKPSFVHQVLREVSSVVDPARHIFVSVAAGVTLASMRACVPDGTRIVRAMSNVACLVGHGCTLYFSDRVDSAAVNRLWPGEHQGWTGSGREGTEGKRDVCDEESAVHATLGVVSPLCERVAHEYLLDASTAVAGSGPALLLLVLEALADAAVRAGFDRTLALRVVGQTALGTSVLLTQTPDTHPGTLRDTITSPAGTTAEGLAALERAAVRAAFLDAVDRALRRSVELSRS